MPGRYPFDINYDHLSASVVTVYEHLWVAASRIRHSCDII